MRRVILPILFVLISTGYIFGTPQIPDIVIYEGKEYPIYNGVLDSYFSKYPERNPKIEEEMCSAAWDGYVATFEIRTTKLFLKDITDQPCGSNRGRSALTKVVPNGDPLFIDWHTGVLLSMWGANEGDPYSLEYLDAFSNYSLFELKMGVLQRVKHLNNKQYKEYRERQFKAYAKTDEYKEILKKRTESGRTTKADIDSDIKVWIFWSAEKLLVD